MMIRPQKVIKLLNFAHLMNQQQERPHKKQYNHAEYFAPEQIEKSEEQTTMAAGELWNVGIILYTFYQGEFPFKGQTDEETIDLIVNRPNNWMPQWREGISESMKNFIMMSLEADPFKRVDKLQYINHPYIMQNSSP